MYLNLPLYLKLFPRYEGLTLTLDVFKCNEDFESYVKQTGLTLTLDVFK